MWQYCESELVQSINIACSHTLVRPLSAWRRKQLPVSKFEEKSQGTIESGEATSLDDSQFIFLFYFSYSFYFG
jgi:hypothetical protein